MSEGEKVKKQQEVFSNNSIKRLLLDVKDIYKSNLEESGIYYKHDENDFSIGYALIIGPKDTIYENGYFFYKFEFPYNYPHEPPKVIFNTNDGNVRFHPNFYRNGKVCLSILNTWRGEGWTSCQTIRSILLTLCSLLTNDSLLNEPGISNNHPDFETYNQIITFKSLSVATVSMLDCDKGIYPSPFFDIFKTIVTEHFIENYKNNLARIKQLRKKRDCEILITKIYNQNIIVDYKSLEDYIKKVYNGLNKKNKSEKLPRKAVKKENEKIEIKKSS